jgi:hypothetical protein
MDIRLLPLSIRLAFRRDGCAQQTPVKRATVHNRIFPCFYRKDIKAMPFRSSSGQAKTTRKTLTFGPA